MRGNVLVQGKSRNESIEENVITAIKTESSTTTTTTVATTTTTTSTIQILLTTVIENSKEIHHEHGLKIN